MAASDTPDTPQEVQVSTGFWALTLGSIGVVFGDIGTSPLYAFREAVHNASGGGPVSREIVLGVLSLILWSLIVVVTLKYVLILLRADNNGEGGTLSLMALGQRVMKRRSWFLLALGVIGGSMFLGDAMITPAISVLSAVEGLKFAAPALEHYVVPLAILVLLCLFAVQSRGTALVASAFGPVMIVWFLTLGVMGLMHISDDPGIVHAMNPIFAVEFLLTHGVIGLVILGAVFLSVTGGEALYADLGHFGRKPIQTAWLYFVLPCLLLNYFGQGALVLSHPEAIENPFYRMVPEKVLVPLICLATAATVIASQAVITGAFSLVRQAIQLGLLPRFEVRYTSESHAGQIYLPRVNIMLPIGSVRDIARGGVGLWHGCVHHHGMRRHHVLRRDLEAMELACRHGGCSDDSAGGGRSDLPDRQSAQAPAGRMGPGAVRNPDGRDDLDVAARRGDPHQQDPAHRSAVGRSDQEPREAATSYRERHGRLSH